MKIAAAPSLYPVLTPRPSQGLSQGNAFRRQEETQRALKTTPKPAPTRPTGGAYATYQQNGQPHLTTRGHFVDQYI